ncbi:MAG: tripartite tricarboxylate transporter substrate binding protein [Rhodocyclaceae bacterium]|nr:tripartite tricarboxylate transporter substrate binding protein [Rhodocyclaceae bacterium]MCE2980829.1 tripartite tricarboxylate transporter substrate binding protein [Betaproteobacteria bacterium]MCA3073765.1 tripartite tricarboxylate transporter substrate binding protein [Rhodocyclaceae bacterium]MCA3091748.1 tripartite tricarboxylate transporter substrate binding protein [Rhodocyclaceae bacterium]MCA3093358.1 tripartite tricarboxylate transporter substrate binding protein [Rhodocyclaceae 
MASARLVRTGSTLVLAAALATAGTAALAQGRPLRLIVPFTPGPGVDLVARTVSDQLSQTMGRTVVVDNRPGAGSVIGVDLAAKSPADGNTLLFVNLAYAINAAMVPNLPYDPLRDLAPVTVVATQPHLLVVNPAIPVKSVRDLIALAKSRPGEITYASAGVGTGPQLVAEMFSTAVGVRMNHIPYKGANPALSDVVGGHAQVMFATLVSSLPQVQAGRLRAVAVTSAKRSRHVPDVPTMIESGLPGFEAVGWFMVMAPARTPAPVLSRLQLALADALAQPAVRERLSGDGAEVVASRPDEAKRFLETEIQRWGAVVKSAGLRRE